MKLNNKINKAKKYKLEQDKYRNSALNKGVNLIAPDTIFLSKDTNWSSFKFNCSYFLSLF